MTTPAPGTWPVAWDLLPERTDDDHLTLRTAADTAVAVLWALTGRQFGLTAAEARPCAGGIPPGIPLTAGRGWQPVIDSGTIRNVSTMTTTCGRNGSVVLPGPVHKVLGFIVDGEELSLDGLVIDGDRIYRWGGMPWPEQDLTRRADESGTWGIRYLRGTPPPAGAAQAVASLAKEFHAAATGGNCQLPRRTTQVARQGVTVSMVDPQEIYDSGATGLTDVDLWIRAMNPYKLSQPASIWSPDMEVR